MPARRTGLVITAHPGDFVWRAGGAIAVRAGGDAGPSPAAQAAALPLALRRADSVRAALVALGVPASDVRATALATARGTRADLIQSP